MINNLNADSCKTKISQERNRQNTQLYSPSEINNAFKTSFNNLGWEESRQTYYLTPDQDLAYETMSLPPEEQKSIIEARNKIAYMSYNQTDFLKNRIAIEVQFGKYAFCSL